MIEITVVLLILLVADIILIWLFSDEHCDKEIEKMIEERFKDE